jgi:hypothetical protein
MFALTFVLAFALLLSPLANAQTATWASAGT